MENFMSVFDEITRWIADAGQEPGSDSVGLYAALCVEEASEMMDATGASRHATIIRDLSRSMRAYGCVTSEYPDLLDAACDLIWVATGLIYSMGIDPNEAMRRVIDSNNSKRQPDGTLQKDATGKVVKPEGYKPPDWEGLL